MTMDRVCSNASLTSCSYLVLDSYSLHPARCSRTEWELRHAGWFLRGKPLRFCRDAGPAQGPRRALEPRGAVREHGAGRLRRWLGDAGGFVRIAAAAHHPAAGTGEERHGLEREPGYRLRPLDQPLPRLRAWLRLLLCPAEPCLC